MTSVPKAVRASERVYSRLAHPHARFIAHHLIVEDDLDTRQLVARLLTHASYSVRVAGNGWEGLIMLEQPVDLVLLDM